MIDNERRKKLQESMKRFNKKHKEEIFKMGCEIKNMGVIATGVDKVDSFLGGGVQRGGYTIFYGQYSCGKTALVLTTIANAQKEGRLCCYINLEKPIEKERFEYFGIDLNEMVYIEAPNCAEDALESLRTLCKDKVIDLFIIDSIQGLSPKSTQETKTGAERELVKKNVASLALVMSNFYNIVNAHVYKSKASVILVGQTRTQNIGGFAVKQGLSGGQSNLFYAYQIIKMRRGARADSPVEKYKEYFCDPDGKVRFQTMKEPCGFSCVLKMEKTNSSKSVKEFKEIEIPFYQKSGFHPLPERTLPFKIEGTDAEKKIINDFLIKKGIIESPEKVDNSQSDVVNLDKEEDYNVSNNESLLVDKPEDVRVEEKPKKKRGRPAKKKEK